uniref:Uncharacterized protein n=1 Tax=Rhizophora mucronata TaxID=61149 RepID=A0A2P2NA94_RHIMU
MFHHFRQLYQSRE